LLSPPPFGERVRVRGLWGLVPFRYSEKGACPLDLRPLICVPSPLVGEGEGGGVLETIPGASPLAPQPFIRSC
jgi:hypothetical protein